MQGSTLGNITPNINPDNNQDNNEPRIVQTDAGNINGQNKCPNCGATDISLNVNTGKLRCNYCRTEFENKQVRGMEEDIASLNGVVYGSGTQDIVADTNDVLTFKCSSCGAEVVIDTSMANQARCHWCRSTLSVNQQIPNGSVPDVVLPFKVTKDEAKKLIEDFVGNRKFFAHPKFKSEFTTNNIMGVYFPYMVVDINGHSHLSGTAEKTVRKYTRGFGNDSTTYYDADVFNVERSFDISIHGLTVESSKDKLNNSATDKTNNIINAIMPFDIENCSKYNANYLKGFTSEKRDVNIDLLKPLINTQAEDIARFAANDTLKSYDRGTKWDYEDFKIIGEQWKSAYLPVWLYSYQEIKGEEKLLHYVAVNARTKETMGSVPIHMPKLLGISFLIEVLGFIAYLFIDFDYNWTFLLVGIIYFLVIFLKYRNANARHTYETDTKKEIRNLDTKDNYVTRKTGLTSARIRNANSNSLGGKSEGNVIVDNIVENSAIAKFISDQVNKK